MRISLLFCGVYFDLPQRVRWIYGKKNKVQLILHLIIVLIVSGLLYKTSSTLCYHSALFKVR